MKITRLVMSVAAAAIAVSAGAGLDDIPDMARYLQDTAVVAIVRIEEASLLRGTAGQSSVPCGVRARASVVQDLTGSRTELEFRFETNALSVGDEYLVYLRDLGAADSSAPPVDRETASRAAQVRAACAPFRRGLQAAGDAVWPVIKRWSDEEGEHETWVAKPAGFTHGLIRAFETLDLSVESLRINDRVVGKSDWDSADVYDGMPAMPPAILTYRGAVRWDSFEPFLVSRILQTQAAVADE